MKNIGVSILCIIVFSIVGLISACTVIKYMPNIATQASGKQLDSDCMQLLGELEYALIQITERYARDILYVSAYDVYRNKHQETTALIRSVCVEGVVDGKDWANVLIALDDLESFEKLVFDDTISAW